MSSFFTHLIFFCQSEDHFGRRSQKVKSFFLLSVIIREKEDRS